MPQLPIYQQQTTARGQGLPTSNRAVPLDNSIAQAVQNVGKAANQVVDAEMLADQQEGKAWAVSAMAQFDLQAYQDFDNLRRSSPAGAKDFAKVYTDRYKTMAQEALKNAPNDAARNILQGHIASRMDEYGKKAFDYEIAERTRWQGEQFIKSTDDRAKLIDQLPYDDVDKNAEESIVLNNGVIDAMDWTPEQKAKLKEENRKKVLEAANYRKMRADPQKYMDDVQPYTGGFDSAMRVVSKNEGGYVAVDGASGAPAIYGINAKWFKNEYEEAKRITDTQGEAAGKAYAAEFYKKNFWDKNKLDRFTPDQQLVLFDGLVNHSQKFGDAMLKAAEGGASAADLIEMRRKEYNRLGKSSEYAPSLDGWMNRLDKVASRTSGQRMITGRSTFDLGTYDEQREWVRQADIEMTRAERMRQQAAEAAAKAERQSIMDEAMPIMYQTSGDWTQIPPALRVKAMQAGLWDDITKYKGIDDPAAVTTLYRMSPEQLADTDLTVYRSSLSQGTYEKFLAKQSELANDPKNKVIYRSVSDLVEQSWREMGKNPNDKGFGAYSDAIENSILAFQKQNGRMPKREEARRLIAQLSLSTDSGDKVYKALDSGLQYDIEGVPQNSVPRIVTALSRFNAPINNNSFETFVEKPSKFITLPGIPPASIDDIVKQLVQLEMDITPENIATVYNLAKNGQ